MWGRPSVPGRGALRLAREDEALLGRHLEADAAACAGPVAIGPQDRSAKIDFVLMPVTEIRRSHDVADGRAVARAKTSGQRIRQPDMLRRSEEHTSELQSLMRHSYAFFRLKKKKKEQHTSENDKT